jgi:hypothetical protein
MNELAFVSSVNRAAVHRHDDPSAFFQGFGCLDRPALVPEQRSEGNRDQDDSGDDRLERATKTRKPRPTGRCGERVRHR